MGIDETEPYIATEENEMAECERCKKMITSKRVGEQFYCNECHKYLRRRKPCYIL